MLLGSSGMRVRGRGMALPAARQGAGRLRAEARARPPPPGAAPLELLWADEFKGPGINASSWSFQLGDGSQYGVPGAPRPQPTLTAGCAGCARVAGADAPGRARAA